MRVGVLVRRPVSAAAAVGIVGVIHAGAEIRRAEGFILVIEAEVVTDLLTGDQRAPGRRIILSAY